MKYVLRHIIFLILTALISIPLPAQEKTAGGLSMDEILKDVQPQKDSKQTSAGQGEMDKILKEAGEYTGYKLPQFPGILNPAMGFTLDLVVPSLSDSKDAYESANTLSMREMGINIYGSVDPFTKAFGTVVGSENIVVDEVYLLSSALPYNIQVRAGKQFANFGRLNKVHPHDLPFIDYPLALQNFLGNPEPETDSKRVALNYSAAFNASGVEFLFLIPTDLYWHIIFGAYNEFTNRGAGSFYSQYLGLPAVDGWRQLNRGLKSFTYTVNSRWFFELHEHHGLRLELCRLIDDPDEFVSRDLTTLTLTYRWRPLGRGLYRGGGRMVYGSL